MKSGVYGVFNLATKTWNIYVGSSIKNAKNRLKEHKTGACSSWRLQRDIRKYGIENFEFMVLEYCEPEVCREREQYWMDLFAKTFGKENLYNRKTSSYSSLDNKWDHNDNLPVNYRDDLRRLGPGGRLEKRCNGNFGCGEWKPIEDFHRKGGNRKGHKCICRKCACKRATELYKEKKKK